VFNTELLVNVSSQEMFFYSGRRLLITEKRTLEGSNEEKEPT